MYVFVPLYLYPITIGIFIWSFEVSILKSLPIVIRSKVVSNFVTEAV